MYYNIQIVYIFNLNFLQCSDYMLTKEMHGRIAIIIVKAVIQHAPFTVDESSTQYLVHSIKQVIMRNVLICYTD